MSAPTIGWAAGGEPASIPDTDGHARSDPESSIYRMVVGGDPAQPATTIPIDAPTQGVAFAAFGENWCGSGSCTWTLGSGTQADAVAIQIQKEINVASTQPGGPKFVLFTGNMRGSGTPEELSQFHRYLKGYRIPVYAALGNLDRFGGLEVASNTGSVNDTVSGSAADYWERTFASAPTPWGSGRLPAGFRDASVAPSIPDPNLARTHYAFDYMVGGKAALRVAVFDSSTRSSGTPEDQNPQEDQTSWLDSVLKSAKLGGIPTVVAMNQPSVLPGPPNDNWTAGGATFGGIVSQDGVSAVVSGGARMNAVASINLVVPAYIVGGGGAPLGYEPAPSDPAPRQPSKLPSDGYYNAWHLFTIRTDKASNLLGQKPVQLTTMPVIESVAMHSYNGTEIPAGDTTTVTAVARELSGGFSDPQQARATYIYYGNTFLSKCSNGGGDGDGLCISDSGLQPKFFFHSNNPDIADFAVPDPTNTGSPQREGFDSHVMRDPGGTYGFLCTFKSGTAVIDVTAGTHRSQMEIHVGPGFGPCADKPSIQVPKVPLPVVKPRPLAPGIEVPRLVVHPESPTEVAILPPPPVPIVAPAPPVAGGYAKKEKHESAREHQGSDFRALQPQPRTLGAHVRIAAEHQTLAAPDSGPNVMLVVGALASLAIVCAMGTALIVRAKAAGDSVRHQ